MQSVYNTIVKYNLIQKNDIVGVAVSGGSDSIALLNFLHEIKDKMNFDIIALHVDHTLRETSLRDAKFVTDYCASKGIKLLSTQVDVSSYCKQNGLSIEDGARELRYNFFAKCYEDKIITKVALAHHMLDQAETVMLHILRGSGLKGACGMDEKRDFYIRPLLHTSKYEIMSYINANNLTYMTDETNLDNEYSRNYIRNVIFPIIQEKFPAFEKNICSFSNNCKLDENYILSNTNLDLLEKKNNQVYVPLKVFSEHTSIIYRLLKKAFNLLQIYKDIEKKHFDIVYKFALEAQNGSKIDLPHNVIVYKDYDKITITNKILKNVLEPIDLKLEQYVFENFGTVTIKKQKSLQNKNLYRHIIDYDKLPTNCVIRYRQEGDIFVKFGGGKKKLKDFFIDKKIPQRKRDFIPLIAHENMVYVVLGIEVSELVKYDDLTKNFLTFVIEKEDE